MQINSVTEGFNGCKDGAQISAELNDMPLPYEIERKFLIEYPDIAWLDSLPECEKTEITQTYLRSENGEERRVRKRGINGSFTCCFTSKRKVTDIRRVEVERIITEEEYRNYLNDADETKRQLSKTRYCLLHGDLCIEIDVYPFWDDRAILEIELADENTEITFPKEISVIREVTSDPSYKNSALASVK